MDHKGQASIEYISTYGWALFVVALAFVVLWQLGFFDPFSRELPGKMGFSVVTPLEWRCGSTSLTAVVTSTAEVSGLAINGTSCNPQTLKAGERSICSLTINCPDAGKAFRNVVTITYTADSVPHQSTGILWGAAGS